MLSDGSGASHHDSMPVAMRAAEPHVSRARAAFPRVPGPVGHLLVLGSLPAALMAVVVVPPKVGLVTANRSVPSARQALAAAGVDTGQVPCISQSRPTAGSAEQPATTTWLPEPGTDRTRQADASLLPGQRAGAPTPQARASPTPHQNPANQPRACETTVPFVSNASCPPSCCHTGPPPERDRVSAFLGQSAFPRHGGDTTSTPMPSIDRAPAAHDKDTWTLESRRLVLRDAEFEGLVGVETATGRKRLLKFTARSLEAADLDLALQRGAATWHLKVGAGTIATAGGPMTLYAERLVGKALRLGGSAAAPRRRVTITPSSVPQWLSTPVPAAQNARHRMVTIEGAALYRIRLTGDGGRGKLPIPCAVSIPCGP